MHIEITVLNQYWDMINFVYIVDGWHPSVTLLIWFTDLQLATFYFLSLWKENLLYTFLLLPSSFIGNIIDKVLMSSYSSDVSFEKNFFSDEKIKTQRRWFSLFYR